MKSRVTNFSKVGRLLMCLCLVLIQFGSIGQGVAQAAPASARAITANNSLNNVSALTAQATTTGSRYI